MAQERAGKTTSLAKKGVQTRNTLDNLILAEVCFFIVSIGYPHGDIGIGFLTEHLLLRPSS